MFIWMAAFCAGVIILYCSGFLLPCYIYILPLFSLFLLPRIKLFWPVLFLLLGYSYANIEASRHSSTILPEALEGQRVQLEAYLCSLPRVSERYSVAEFCVLSFRSTSEKVDDQRFLLRWPHSMDIDLQKGGFDFIVRLKRPHGTVNPVGGSYERYLFHQRISATGLILESLKSRSISQPYLSLGQTIHQGFVLFRLAISNHLNIALSGYEHRGILTALILGERSGISSEDNRVLSMTGTQHLMAISGLHVGVILIGLFFCLPKTKKSLILVSGIGLVYISLVGFSASSQRAWVMCVLALIYISGFMASSRWRAYLLALTVVLLLDPLATLNVGFWFSFICVALLLFLTSFSKRNQSAWLGFWLVQTVLFIGLIPVNSYLGLPHSLSNSLANLIAIPWVSLIVLPGSLLSLAVSFIDIDSARFGFAFLNECIHILMTFLDSLSAVYRHESIERSAYLISGILLCLLVIIVFSRLKFMSVCLMLILALFVFVPARTAIDKSAVLVFDSGQGLAVSMIWANQFWLYDTGPAFGSMSTKDSAILPYLRSFQLLKNMTGIVVSHGDSDHAGGLSSLLESLKPKEAWVGELARLPEYQVLGQNIMRPCVTGMRWEKAQGLIEVLYPFPGAAGQAVFSSNNHSCVIRFTLKGKVFLFMGDLEGKAEYELVKRYRHKLKADVLIAGHHGSVNATNYALLKHVLPTDVVFSSGYLNRFNHPHQDVLERVRKFGARIHNTALDGALSFYPDEESGGFMTVKKYRHNESFFWLQK